MGLTIGVLFLLYASVPCALASRVPAPCPTSLAFCAQSVVLAQLHIGIPWGALDKVSAPVLLQLSHNMFGNALGDCIVKQC